MKKPILLILFFLLRGITYSQAPGWNWAKSGRGAGFDYGNSISTDSYGNSYITGYFQNPSVVFGDDTLSGSETYHDSFFLVKYDSTGQEIWARSAGGENNAYGTWVSTDGDGNSYVTGYFQGTGTINFGGFTLLSSAGGSSEAFVAKFDPSGNVLWAKAAGALLDFGTGGNISNGIDSRGNVYIVGNSPDFLADTITNFIQKYNTSGSLVWQRPVSGKSMFPNIATDSDGNCYVTGCFMGD